MGTLIILALLGFMALVWLVSEPISGVLGSGCLAKVMAIIIAIKLIGMCIGWLMGPATMTVPL